MSHLPFLTVESTRNLVTDGTLDPDSLRVSSDKTASDISSTSATDNLVHAVMPSTDASSSSTAQVLLFPVAAAITLGLSATLYSFVPDLAGYELATVSRTISAPEEVGVRIAWRLAEIGVAWFAGLDYWDFASLFFLYSAPYYFLLALFYEISAMTIFLALTVELTTSTLPFLLMRRLSPHNAALRAPSSTNTLLATSFTIRTYVTLFATAIFAVTTYTSLYTWLPVYLVSNFDSIRTLEHAHGAQLPVLLGMCLPLGIAAKDYLFTPSLFYARTSLPKDFDAETATFGETLAYNLGLTGWGVREDVLVKRTALLVFMQLAVAVAKIWGTIDGAELWGALGWGSVFASAGLMTGAGYAWVGDV